jgi:hypothetical protein
MSSAFDNTGIQDCEKTEENAPADDVLDGQIKGILEKLPACEKTTIAVASAFPPMGGGASTATGCEQINIMKQKISNVQKDLTCQIKKKIQSVRVDATQVNRIKIDILDCEGDLNIEQANNMDVNVMSNFTSSEVQKIKNDIVSAITSGMKNDQDQDIGFMGTGDGSKNLQLTTIDTKALRNDVSSDNSLNEMLTTVEQDNTLLIKKMKGSQACNLKQTNQASLVAQIAMDTVIKKIKTTTQKSDVVATDTDTQKTKAKGISSFIDAFTKLLTAWMWTIFFCCVGLCLVSSLGMFLFTEASSSTGTAVPNAGSKMAPTGSSTASATASATLSRVFNNPAMLKKVFPKIVEIFESNPQFLEMLML